MRNRSGSFNAGANRPAASAPVAIPARNAGAATPSDGSASDAASTFPSPVRRIAAALQARLSPLARLGSLGLPRPQAHGLFRGNTVHPAPDAESSLSPRMDQPDDIESIGMFALDDVTPIMPLNDSLDAISSSLENWVDSASSDEQASARKRASVRIRLAAQQGSPRLDLSRCELDSLPNCLHMLGALRALAVNNNRMTVLPSRMPPRLAHLSARSNQLVRLPASLPDTITMLIVGNNKITGLPPRLPSNLRALCAESNQIDSVPTPLPSTLETVSLANNSLSMVPVEWPAGIRNVFLHENPIRDIPLALTVAAPHASFHFSLRGLSRESLELLDIHAAVRTAFQGEYPSLGVLDPRVQFFIPPDAAAPALIAAHGSSDRTASAGTVEMRLQRRAVWQALYTEATDSGVMPNPVVRFSNFLLRLRENVTYGDASGLAALRQRIKNLLDPLQADPTLLASCLAIADDALQDCGDRRRLALDNMEMTILSQQAGYGHFSSVDLLRTARQFHALDALEVYAEKFGGQHNGEMVEIKLALRMELGNNLGLAPADRTMQHRAYAERIGVNTARIDDALESITAELADHARCVDFLTNWAPWKAQLQRLHSQEFEQMDAEYEAAKATLHERLTAVDHASNASEATLMEQYKTLQAQFDTLEHRTYLPLRRQLTETLMHAVSEEERLQRGRPLQSHRAD